MRDIFMATMLTYLSLIIWAAALGLWFPKAETCESYFTENPMSYILAPGWYPACKLTHLEFKCPDSWTTPMCGGK